MNIKTVALGAWVAGSLACQAPARLAGRWVMLSGNAPVAVGVADAPEAGGPMRLVPGSPAAGACLDEGEYARMFGPVCAHDPEGGPPGAEADVRWYCHGDLAVRVRLERCPNRARLRVVELAVAPGAR